MSDPLASHKARFEADPEATASFEWLEETHFLAEEWEALAEVYRHRLEAPSLESQTETRAQLNFRLGQLLEDRLEDTGGAILAYRECVSLDPTRRPVWERLRGLYAARGSWTAVLQVAELELVQTQAAADRVSLLDEMARVWREQLDDADEAASLQSQADALRGEAAPSEPKIAQEPAPSEPAVAQEVVPSEPMPASRAAVSDPPPAAEATVGDPAAAAEAHSARAPADGPETPESEAPTERPEPPPAPGEIAPIDSVAPPPHLAQDAAEADTSEDGDHERLVQILNDIVARIGWIPDAATRQLAEELNLSRADVHGVVSYYHDFRREPPGEHIIKVCQAEACQAMGSRELTRHAEAALGVDLHTSNAQVSLEPVYCLGNCACAPAIMIDGKTIGKVTAERFDELIVELRGSRG